MHRILRYLSVAIILVAAGCGEDNPTGGNSSKGSISAKVDGNSWSATDVQAVYTSGVFNIGGAQISGGDNKQINIGGMISAPGTYQLGGFSGITVTYTEGSAANVKIFLTQSGTMKVDQLTSTGAKGTFSFQAKEQQGSGVRSVTEGTFDVKF